MTPCRFNLDSQLAAPLPLLGASGALQDEQTVGLDRADGTDVNSSSSGTGLSATTSEQLANQRSRPATWAACSDDATDIASVECHHDAAASAQSTAALLHFLRQALDRADALMFEVREQEA